MQIIGAQQQEIDTALAAVNQIFGGNVEFNRYEQTHTRRDGRPVWQVTLRVTSSRGPGHRLGFPHFHGHAQHRLTAACWHVYGSFIDALPSRTVVRSSLAGRQHPIMPGDAWQDQQVGSRALPVMLSQLCECSPDRRDADLRAKWEALRQRYLAGDLTEDTEEQRRLVFARWLVEHGILSETPTR